MLHHVYCLDIEVTASLSVCAYIDYFICFVFFSIEIARQPPIGWLAHRHITNPVLDSLAVILCSMHDYKLARQMKRFLNSLIYLMYPSGKEGIESIW